MKLHHTPWHWIAVGAVLAVALFTLGEVHGQSTGPAAVFEGRPAMAGAQAGTGAMAGPPQGGLGPQNPDQPGGGLTLHRPAAVEAAGPVPPRDPGVGRPGGSEVQPRRDRDAGEVVRRDRDSGALRDQNAAPDKARRGTKRSIERSRRGVGGVDS
ncbi:MAG TPA: hypothetical protein VFE82_03010 [Ramlibacter sp.]|jgi:hypothetical protein|uniref:hypothetical protein n=1 Tax=Ramlibacter sp. TaxID=1917967 RepID=UPI002D3E33B9|nr:hypothetical protein [Ramlibacter sp.]HZY17420.1 hypothetical protein [Ramlibacter sp.]